MLSASCSRTAGDGGSAPESSRPATALEIFELAQFDAELAAALGDRPVVHGPGTVVTVEYTALGNEGENLRRWQVRALTPNAELINLEPDVWQAQVPDIETKLQTENGVVLREPGSPGLPWEAVKRMPIAESFEFAARDEPFTTTDLDGTTERAARSSQARLRVRVVASCQADVRIERDRKLEFAPFAILPIPTGLRERRWVQMKGCPIAPRPNVQVSGAGVSDDP